MPMTSAQIAYRRFLETPLWKYLRHKAVTRDGGKCVRCGATKNLNVHHKIYRRRWCMTQLEDLETLCRDHHQDEHKPEPKRGWFWTKDEDLEYIYWTMHVYIKRIMKGRKLGRIAQENIASALSNYPNDQPLIGHARRIKLFSEVMGVDA